MIRWLLLLWVVVVGPVFGSLCAVSLNEQGALTSVKYTRNGEYVITGSPVMVRWGASGFPVPYFDLRARTLLLEFGYAGENAVFSPEGSVYASFRSGMLTVVEVATQKELLTDIDRSHPGNVSGVAFDSTGQRLAIVTSEPYAAIHVVEVPSGRSLVRYAQFGENDFSQVRWSHDDRYLVTIDRTDNELTLWEVNPKIRPNEKPREVKAAKVFRFGSEPRLSQDGLLVAGAIYHEEPFQKAAEFGVWQIYSGRQVGSLVPPDRLGLHLPKGAPKASFQLERLFTFQGRTLLLGRWSVAGTRIADLELFEVAASGEIELVATLVQGKEIGLVEVSPSGESFIVTYAHASADLYRTADLIAPSR